MTACQPAAVDGIGAACEASQCRAEERLLMTARGPFCQNPLELLCSLTIIRVSRYLRFRGGMPSRSPTQE
jgi:hypothetical protein